MLLYTAIEMRLLQIKFFLCLFFLNQFHVKKESEIFYLPIFCVLILNEIINGELVFTCIGKEKRKQNFLLPNSRL